MTNLSQKRTSSTEMLILTSPPILLAGSQETSLSGLGWLYLGWKLSLGLKGRDLTTLPWSLRRGGGERERGGELLQRSKYCPGCNFFLLGRILGIQARRTDVGEGPNGQTRFQVQGFNSEVAGGIHSSFPSMPIFSSFEHSAASISAAHLGREGWSVGFTELAALQPS